MHTCGVLRRWRTLSRIARFLIGGAVAVPTAGVVFVAVVLFAPAVGPISPNALYWSVSLEVGGTQLFGSDGCTKQHGRRWICQITDGQGSGSAAYDVVLEGDCWQARRTPGETSFEGSMAIRASDCVGLRDQVRLLERALKPISEQGHAGWRVVNLHSASMTSPPRSSGRS